MMLNVDFSGIGAGFLNMLMYVIVAVFLAGLMVGRTPEYLGKKIEAREVKLAMIVVLIHPILITCGTALFAATDWGTEDRGQPRPARLQRGALRVHLGRGEQRVGVRGIVGQQPRVEHRDGRCALARPVPGARASDRDRRVSWPRRNELPRLRELC